MISISVVMTVYNSEQFIVEAIESILKQSFKDFELVIVDDGSTDNSVSFIQSFQDSRIKLFLQQHIGRSKALNFAISQTNSDIIAIADADDISVSTRLEKQYITLTQNISIGIVGSWFQNIDKKGKRGRIFSLPEYHDEIEFNITKPCAILFGASMIRKKYLVDVGMFNTSLCGAEDFDIFFKLLSKTVFYNIQEILVFYRIYSTSFSQIHKTEVKQNIHHFTTVYLNKKLELSVYPKEKGLIYFRFGLVEYYNGSMKKARKYFYQALFKGYCSVSFLRFFFPSHLGDKFFIWYRNYFYSSE